MDRGKVQRRLMRTRARLQPTPAHNARAVYVGSESDLAAALQAASWWNTSRTRRLHLVLGPGTYHQHIELLDGVDLTGPAEIVWDGPEDTILTHGSDGTLTDLTVRHVGPDIAYAVHADAPCRGSVLNLRRVHLTSESKPALGAGLFGGQHLNARDSTFASDSYAAIHLHPWTSQTQPATATFAECTATSPNTGIMWHQLDSGQADELHWTGTINAPQPLSATRPPPVLDLNHATAPR